jgi:hypothetical protein
LPELLPKAASQPSEYFFVVPTRTIVTAVTSLGEYPGLARARGAVAARVKRAQPDI